MTIALAHRPPGVDDLAQSIVATAGRLAAATCDWLLLVADFDARDGAAVFGLGTTSRWLAHHCSLAQRTAEEHVRVARALARHRRLAEEMSAGRLTYSHVRAISRTVAEGEDELVEELVNCAEHGTVRQLESLVRGLRTVRDIAEDDGGPPEEYVKQTWSSRGQLRVTARLDPERGTLVESAISAVARSENLSRPDALVRLAEIALAALADAGRAPRALRGHEEAAVVIHVDASLPAKDEPERRPDHGSQDSRPVPTRARRARRRRTRPSRRQRVRAARRRQHLTPATAVQPQGHRHRSRERPLGRVADGPGLPRPVVERLLCIGRIRTVIRDGNGPRSDVLDLGRSHRLVSARQFRALLLRDGGCAYPGCASRHGLEAHHVRHWIDGGPTDMANLVLLCKRHHHAEHDGAFQVEPTPVRGRFRFVRADGVELPEHVDASVLIPAGSPPITDDHLNVASDAITTRWDGQRMEFEYAVSVLAPYLTCGSLGAGTRSADRPIDGYA